MDFSEPMTTEPAPILPREMPLVEPEIGEATTLQAENCIKKHVIAAMGIGLIPSAMLDVAGITAIEVRMIRKLAHIYSFAVPNKLVVLKVLISLVGSIGPVYISLKLHSAMKGVPLVGYAVSVGLLSATGGAAVYAVGKLFQIHFESGGTFLSKDNSLIRDYFRKKYKEGKRLVRDYRQQASQPAGGVEGGIY